MLQENLFDISDLDHWFRVFWQIFKPPINWLINNVAYNFTDF